MRVARSRFGGFVREGMSRVALALAATALLASPSPAQDPDLEELIYQPTNEDGFQLIGSGGFGDRLNSWAASMRWYKGDLYVGTSRAVQCVTLATVGSKLPVDLYPILGTDCPDDTTDLALAAEIWRYRPATGDWDRVYVSPVDIPVRQSPAKYTARDIAFRAMNVVKEPAGHEALYVGGMSAADVFPEAFGAMATPPPPRILRTLDGVNWQAVPQAPGTLMGDLGKQLPGSKIKPVVFNALVGHRGRLFATVGDSLGNSAIIASSEPASGNDAWKLASPLPESFPVTALAVYNDLLYCGVAGRGGNPYRIFKADTAGPAPLSFSLVLSGAAAESGGAWRPVGFAEFNGRLYVGTGSPPELVRIDTDDSWELIAGQPRLTDEGVQRPLSGLSLGLGSAFTAQLRGLAVHEGKLYLGASDWSGALERLPSLGEMAQFEFGFDLFRSADGISWTPVSRNGFGVAHQPIPQTMQSTPGGLFIGSAAPISGTHVWRKSEGPETEASSTPAVPERMDAVSDELGEETVVLSWEPSPGASHYRVYRATVTPIFEILGGSPVDGGPILEVIQEFCDVIPLVCALLSALQSDLGVPSPFVWVATTADTFFVDERASSLPALYFVRAEDAAGGFSSVSNMVGGPSGAAFITFPGIDARLDAADQKQPARSRSRIQKLFRRARTAGLAGNLTDSDRLLRAAEKGLKQGPVAQRVSAKEAQDLAYFLQGLRRNLWLAEQELVPLDAVLEGVP